MTKYKVGDVVTIHKVMLSPSIISWIPDMDQYDGKTARIIRLTAYDMLYELDIDHQSYWWHEDFLEPASGIASSHQNTQQDGCRCSKCGDFVPYVETSSTFVCYSCKH